MTLRWMDGFEVDGTNAYFAAKYANRPSAVTVTTPGRKFGSYMQGTTLITFPLSTTPIDEWVTGLGWYTGTNPNPATDFVAFHLSGVPQLSVHLLATRFLEVRRGTTVLETATIEPLPDQDWAYIEFKALLHTSAGSYEVRVNGVTVASGTGVNTANSGQNDADNVKLASNANNRFDDWYVLDTAGGVQNDFLGPKVIEGLLPNGNGDVQQFTPSTGMDHAALVDDPASAFNASDYVSSTTNTHVELLEFADLERIKGGIAGVSVNTMAALNGVGSRVIRARYRGPTDLDGNGPNITVGSPQTENRQAIFEQEPTGAADTWAVADIDDGQFGVEVVS